MSILFAAGKGKTNRMMNWNFFVLDQLPDPVVILDPDDRIIFLNAPATRFAEMFQAPVQPGTLFTDFVVSGRSDFAGAILQQIKNERAPRVQDMEFHDQKGAPYNVEITYSPSITAAGQTLYTVILIREISNERIFEKKASQLVTDFSNLIEHANAVIFGLDSQQYITEWNEECVRITGRTQDDVLAQHVEDIIAPGSRDALRQSLEQVYASKPIANFQVELPASDGRPVIVLLNATPRINNAGVVIGILFVGQDITELDRYRQSLENMVLEKTAELTHAVEKEKELIAIRNRFVSLASHEFRIPLTNILAAAGAIRDQDGNDPASLDKIKNIESQVGHMRALIDDLLTIGKADAHKLQPRHQVLDLIAFLKGICEEVIISAHHSHAIHVDCTEAILNIDSDQKLLRNVFINLLSNAIKFSPGKEHVFVSISKNGQKVEISIRDQGIGIAEADLEKVFEPFNRADNASDIKGTGLGLSIVKRAVETLGGTITLKSDIQKGTEFTITLNC